jgi:hypothetical protein
MATEREPLWADPATGKTIGNLNTGGDIHLVDGDSIKFDYAGLAKITTASGQNLALQQNGTTRVLVKSTGVDFTNAITAGTSITATLGDITATDGDVVITDATNGVKVGANKVLGARGAALTAQLTSLTHTAPGTPDYALQDLTDTGGFGFKTKDEGNSVLAVILNLQTRVAELEARLKVTGGHGLIAD